MCISNTLCTFVLTDLAGPCVDLYLFYISALPSNDSINILTDLVESVATGGLCSRHHSPLWVTSVHGLPLDQMSRSTAAGSWVSEDEEQNGA